MRKCKCLLHQISFNWILVLACHYLITHNLCFLYRQPLPIPTSAVRPSPLHPQSAASGRAILPRALPRIRPRSPISEPPLGSPVLSPHIRTTLPLQSQTRTLSRTPTSVCPAQRWLGQDEPGPFGRSPCRYASTSSRACRFSVPLPGTVIQRQIPTGRVLHSWTTSQPNEVPHRSEFCFGILNNSSSCLMCYKHLLLTNKEFVNEHYFCIVLV